MIGGSGKVNSGNYHKQCFLFADKTGEENFFLTGMADRRYVGSAFESIRVLEKNGRRRNGRPE